MDSRAFSIGMKALVGVLPYAKRLGEEELKFLYLTLDQKVRTEVTNDMWMVAVKQRIEETEPPQEMPLHTSVLRHLYRCENGTPNFTWGLKPAFVTGLLEGSREACV